MKLSVIIPIYNTASTLRQCVESVTRQSVEDMEIILVDDASPDGAGRLAEELAQTDKRIRVLSISHSGLSEARNAGIREAAGELITFVDSDDEIADQQFDFYLSLFDSHKQHIDILEYPAKRDCGWGYLPKKTAAYFTTPAQYWLQTRGWEHCYACNKIFRREIFDQEKFLANIHFEDVEFMSRLLTKPLNIFVSQRGQYIYHDNPNGITHRADANDLKQLYEWNLRAYNIIPTAAHFEQILNIALDIFRASGELIELPEKRYCRTIKQLSLNVLGFKRLCELHKAIIK